MLEPKQNVPMHNCGCENLESNGRYTKYVGTLTGIFIPAGTRIRELGEITDGKFLGELGVIGKDCVETEH